MKILYVSHPFTGDEKENRKEARLITAALQRKYPKYHFYNPLDALRPQEEAGLDYTTILKHCENMIRVCDGVILTGAWMESKGCKQEARFAELNMKPLYTGIGIFELDETISEMAAIKFKQHEP